MDFILKIVDFMPKIMNFTLKTLRKTKLSENNGALQYHCVFERLVWETLGILL